MNAETDAADTAVFEGSGNVFADLNLPSGDDDMLKVAIARSIAETVQQRKLTQSEAARLIGVDQAKVSQILRGRLRGYSADRLMRYLTLLGRDVDIRISPNCGTERGRIKVMA